MPGTSLLQVAVVGTGGRSTLWLIPALAARPDIEIVALADRCPARAAYAASKVGIQPRICASVEEVLEPTTPDAVFVTTPDGHHAEVVLPALAAGAMVFCEKPLETTLAKCRAIAAADARAGGKVFVGFNLRYAPTYALLKAELAKGTIGRLLTIQMDEFYDGGRSYFRRWNRLRSEGGGLWITKASHDFDLMAWLAGTPPRQVAAFAELSHYRPKAEAGKQCRDCRLAESCPDRAAPPPDYLRIWEENGGPPHDLCLYNSDKDTFDHGIATVHFDDGIVGTYTCNVVSGFSDRRIRVSGTRGTIEGALTSPALTLRRRDPAATETLTCSARTDLHGGADGHILDSFLAFARGDGEPKCRPQEATLAVQLGLAATLSGDQGRMVALDELTE